MVLKNIDIRCSKSWHTNVVSEFLWDAWKYSKQNIFGFRSSSSTDGSASELFDNLPDIVSRFWLHIYMSYSKSCNTKVVSEMPWDVRWYSKQNILSLTGVQHPPKSVNILLYFSTPSRFQKLKKSTVLYVKLLISIRFVSSEFLCATSLLNKIVSRTYSQ